jgi:hypothetical protein
MPRRRDGEQLLDGLDHLAGVFDHRQMARASEDLEPVGADRFVDFGCLAGRQDPVVLSPDQMHRRPIRTAPRRLESVGAQLKQRRRVSRSLPVPYKVGDDCRICRRASWSWARM